MYGLEAINANNGWAISVVGITIVFSGLVMLSLLISQLYKVLEFYDNPEKLNALFRQQKKHSENQMPDRAALIETLTLEQKETFKQIALLVRTMEDHFSLPRLLHLARISGLTDPHSHLNLLLELGIIAADQKGYFCWNQDLFEQAV